LPQKSFRQRRKNCYANLQNYFARLTPPNNIISKSPWFRALYLARRNEFRFFRLTNTKTYLFILAAGFCLKNLAFVKKIMALPESGEGGGCSCHSPPGAYAYNNFSWNKPILGSSGRRPRNGTAISLAICSAPPVVAANISVCFYKHTTEFMAVHKFPQ